MSFISQSLLFLYDDCYWLLLVVMVLFDILVVSCSDPMSVGLLIFSGVAFKLSICLSFVHVLLQ